MGRNGGGGVAYLDCKVLRCRVNTSGESDGLGNVLQGNAGYVGGNRESDDGLPLAAVETPAFTGVHRGLEN